MTVKEKRAIEKSFCSICDKEIHKDERTELMSIGYDGEEECFEKVHARCYSAPCIEELRRDTVAPDRSFA